MKRAIAITAVLGAVVLLTGVAFAQMGWDPGYGMGWGPGGMMGSGPGAGGQYACPGVAGAGPGTEPVSADTAKQIAHDYAEKYLKGYTVERVLPFTGMRGWTAYSVELKGPNDEVRILHVNPWGGVMPFGGPARRTG